MGKKIVFVLLVIMVVLIMISCKSEPPLEKTEISMNEYTGKMELAIVEQKIPTLKQLRKLYTRKEWDSIEVMVFLDTYMEVFSDVLLPTKIEEIHIDESRYREIPLMISIKDSSTLKKIHLNNLVIDKVELQGKFSNLERLDFVYCKVNEFPDIPVTSKITELKCYSRFGKLGMKNQNTNVDRFWFATLDSTLDGLEKFPNLKWLVVSRVDDYKSNILEQSNLADISAIESLKNLDFLWIRGAQVLSDISPLYTHKVITNLRIEDIPNLKIENLAGMENLVALSLERCNLTDTRFLDGMKNKLEVLLLEGNPIKEIVGLSECLVSAEIMKERQPGKYGPPVYPYTIDADSVELITLKDYEYLRDSGYYGMKILDDRISNGLAKIMD